MLFRSKFGETAYEHGLLGVLVQALEDAFPGAELDRSDGLKLTLPDGWINLRASNTEPLVRLAAEARTRQQVDDLYGRVMQLVAATDY